MLYTGHCMVGSNARTRVQIGQTLERNLRYSKLGGERGREGCQSDNSRDRKWPAYHVLTYTHTYTRKVDTRRRTQRGPRSDRVEGRYSTAAARKARPPPRPPPVYFPDATFSPPSDRYRRAGHRHHVAQALPSQRHPRFHLTSLVSPPFSPSPGILLFLSFPSSHVYIARSLAVSLSRVL